MILNGYLIYEYGRKNIFFQKLLNISRVTNIKFETLGDKIKITPNF